MIFCSWCWPDAWVFGSVFGSCSYSAVAYPSVSYTHESISVFPNEAEHLVVLYGAVKSLQNVLGNKTVSLNNSDDIATVQGEVDLSNNNTSNSSLERLQVYRNAKNIPGVVEHRFNQLQEIEAILEFLNIQLRKIRSKHYKKFLENYQRALTSNDVRNYIDGEDDVVDMANLVNEFALLRNKFLGLLKAIDAKQFQINNIVKLRVAGLDDAELFAKK